MNCSSVLLSIGHARKHLQGAENPVHPDLIKLGLWERVARLKAAGEKLFPG
ncbi:hypothetical protein K8O61_14630 [Xanthomonas cerealis pv. cerealis]|uniref:hypothetical protein n=1 Tax=Xanthomonas cerealis TaxID=3390025 RepID=UPI001F35F18B|nr:hypothetical protein [Xanthomonas translucens]UKE68703.1 hypothetical protein K8O61_14630 [Xanthomonas translucens pv. pistacia]